MPRPRGSKKQREQQARRATGGGRLVGYIRVSTEGQHTNGHSLAGQEQRLREACERAGYTLAAVLQDVASGSKADRDGLVQAQALVEGGDAEGLVFAKFDRVTRSMLHGAALVEWARQGGHTLLSADEGAMVTQGALVNEALPFFQALAQVERERISRRTKEGLAAAKARGVRLGSKKRTEATDPVAKRAVELRRKGQTIAAIAATLNTEGYTTVNGNAWASGNTYTMLRRVAPDALPEGATPRNRRRR